MDRDKNGKTKVVKLGTKEITREGFEYELTLNLEIINDNHLVIASKDRSGLFMNKPEFVITPGTGKLLMKWCNNGRSEQDALDEIQQEINECTIIEGLRHVYAKYPNYQSKIKDAILKRKMELDQVANQMIPNKEVINNLKAQENGSDTSTTE